MEQGNKSISDAIQKLKGNGASGTVTSAATTSVASKSSSADFSNLKPVKASNTLYTIVDAKLTASQELDGRYLQINVGDSIEGYYKGMSKKESGGFTFNEATITNVDGADIVVTANTSLFKQLQEVAVGSPVKIIYKGQSKAKSGPGKGKMLKNWDVLA